MGGYVEIGENGSGAWGRTTISGTKARRSAIKLTRKSCGYLSRRQTSAHPLRHCLTWTRSIFHASRIRTPSFTMISVNEPVSNRPALERVGGIEPLVIALEARSSTIKLHPQIEAVRAAARGSMVPRRYGTFESGTF